MTEEYFQQRTKDHKQRKAITLGINTFMTSITIALFVPNTKLWNTQRQTVTATGNTRAIRIYVRNVLQDTYAQNQRISRKQLQSISGMIT